MKRLVVILTFALLARTANCFDYHIPLQQDLQGMGYSIDIYNDEINGDVFFQVAENHVSIIDQQSAWELDEALGWYVDPHTVSWVIGGPMTGLPFNQVLPDINEPFAFSLMTSFSTGGDYQWYSQRQYNDDLADHAHVFKTRINGILVPHSYILAWEDLPALGDADFQDMVVRVDGVQATQGSAVPVPESSTAILFALGTGLTWGFRKIIQKASTPHLKRRTQSVN